MDNLNKFERTLSIYMEIFHKFTIIEFSKNAHCYIFNSFKKNDIQINIYLSYFQIFIKSKEFNDIRDKINNLNDDVQTYKN